MRKAPPAPAFNELYDCAGRVDDVELVLYRRPRARRYPLELVLRRVSDGEAVHSAVVRSTVEEAASRIAQAAARVARRRGRS